MRISVLIPVFNEADSILEIIKRVRAVPIDAEIVVVDDHSTDCTAEVLAELRWDNIIVLTHPNNRGKGAAIRTALAAASGEVAVIQDADLEYCPADFLEMVKPIAEGRTKVVFGVRDLSNQELLRRLGNQMLTIATNLVRFAPPRHGNLLQDGGLAIVEIP